MDICWVSLGLADPNLVAVRVWGLKEKVTVQREDYFQVLSLSNFQTVACTVGMASRIELSQIALPVSSFQDIYSSGYRLRKPGKLRNAEHERGTPVKQLCQGVAGKVDLLGIRYILEVLHLSTMTIFPRMPYRGFLVQRGLPCRNTFSSALECSSFTTIFLEVSFWDRNLRDLSKEPSIPHPHILKASNFLKGGSRRSQPVFLKKPMGC